jgi:hypothetical protein
MERSLSHTDDDIETFKMKRGEFHSDLFTCLAQTFDHSKTQSSLGPILNKELSTNDKTIVGLLTYFKATILNIIIMS